MKYLLIGILLSIFCLPILAQDPPEKLWDRLIPKLDSTLKLKEKQETLPNSSLLKADKKSNQKDINHLMDEAIEILEISPSQLPRKRILDLEADIQEANKQITEYQEKMVTAPTKKPAWKAWETTQEDYEKKIEDQKKRIEKDRNEIEKNKESLRKELQGMGINLTSEELDFLLSTVVGDDVIQMSVAFNNVKAVTLKLEELMVKTGENVDVARRYYGMYCVLLEIMDHMYQQVIDDIDLKYIPRIEGGKNEEGKKIKGIIPKTEELLKQTEALVRNDSSGKNKAILSANIEAQKLTLQAAELYRKYLETQRASILQSKQKLAPDIATARNTYETVKVSSELVAMMKSSQNVFDTLKNLQIPELRVFQNLEMKKEFEKLTLQLKSGS